MENKLKLSDQAIAALNVLFLKCLFTQQDIRELLKSADFATVGDLIVVTNPEEQLAIPEEGN